MEELVYKLNLPPLPDILLDSTSIFKELEKMDHCYLKPSDFLKPEWLSWNGFEWNHISFFVKRNKAGIIHSDGMNNWGINWIYNGFGKMDYWRVEDVVSTLGVDPLGSKRISCTTDKPPFKSYNTPEGAYLVNAEIPHLATGVGNRYALSLRAYGRTPVQWPKVVKQFQSYII